MTNQERTDADARWNAAATRDAQNASFILTGEARERACYGCTESDAIRNVGNFAKIAIQLVPLGGESCEQARLRAAVGSILSDVQEMITLGLDERARQALNIAKLALFQPEKILSR